LKLGDIFYIDVYDEEAKSIWRELFVVFKMSDNTPHWIKYAEVLVKLDPSHEEIEKINNDRLERIKNNEPSDPQLLPNELIEQLKLIATW
jgi:hypothetical protein